MPIQISIETAVVFLAFVIGVFTFYKVFKLLVRGSIIVFASFMFPWVAQYVGLPIVANLDLAINFALAGLGLFLIYEFYHFVVHLFKILMWPFKSKKKK